MKKLLLLSALFITTLIFAQVPQGVSYQAIALNGSGTPVVSSNVGLRLSVLNTSATGTVVYSETQTRPTNAQGLFNLVIGQGTPTSGTFAAINWGNGSKFLKVEMDVAGGTNYVLVGTTQLLSVPYAMAAAKFVGAPGEGITLVSPNGTPYTLSVNDAGQLSLPTTGSSSTWPSSLYVFGSYNNFNPASAQMLSNDGGYFNGFKYFAAGSQIKFTAGNTASSTVYGLNGDLTLQTNSAAYTVSSNGFYFLSINHFDTDPAMTMNISNISPVLHYEDASGDYREIFATYNAGTNTFTFTGATNIVNTTNIYFQFPNNFSGLGEFGDNLADGSIDPNGAPIHPAAATATPKNFTFTLVMNVNGSGTYTATVTP